MTLDTAPRLTFNFPAIRHYFDDDKIGVGIKIENGVVFIKPVWSLNSNSLEVVQRGEHGKQVIISGEVSAQLLAVLTSTEGFPNRPFFVMKPANNGWIRLEHYKEDAAPKLVPHIRLWMPKPHTDTSIPSDIGVMLDAFTTRIAECQSVVKAFEGKPGRPPREVQAAKGVLTSFVRLASVN